MSPTPNLIGVVLDKRYRIDGQLARGGMSTVYVGLDIRLDRPVAIKVMDPRYTADQQFLTRFAFEARSVAKLKAPGLVAVYDQGQDYGLSFLVMELVDGGTLRELLRERGPMPPHAVRAVAQPVLEALAAAHDAGLVHRDIKPENILIARSGDVKLADFGLVRAVASAQITSSGVILGTAAYVSPEQVRTGRADARSDVYSMGLLCYELLTGSVPFVGDTALTVAYQRMDNDVPAPSSVIEGVPEEFDDLVLRATSRDPDQRYPTAREMADDLSDIAEYLHLPRYRVPAPHVAPTYRPAPARPHVSPRPVLGDDATTHLRPVAPVAALAPLPPGHKPTRAVTNVPLGYAAPVAPQRAEPVEEDTYDDEYADDDDDANDFFIDRARSRRQTALWMAIVLILAFALGTGGWLLGSGLIFAGLK